MFYIFKNLKTHIVQYDKNVLYKERDKLEPNDWKEHFNN